MRFLFITGWQRSGTTLLSKALNAHPEMTIASQPFFDFFKMARNKLYKDILGITIAGDMPMDDYFLLDQVRKDCLKENLHRLNFSGQEIEELKRSITATNLSLPGEHSPLIIPFLEELKAGSFLELFTVLINLVQKAYGNEKTAIIGIKEIYCEQFIEALADKVGFDLKSIIIYRDPRAVFASRNTGNYFQRVGSKYALLFIVRNWRKSIAFHLHYTGRRDYYGLKYEDLAAHPEAALKEICAFAGLNYFPEMLNTTAYLDGNNQQWSANTSYNLNSGGITSRSVDQWRQVLSADTVKAIEATCEGEMKHLGYSLDYSCGNLLDLLSSYQEEEELIRPWQQKYGYLLTPAQLEKEVVRSYLLKRGPADCGQLGDLFFIFPQVYHRLKSDLKSREEKS